MFLPAFLLIAFMSAVIFLAVKKANRERSGWPVFYSKGIESGFSPREMEMIWDHIQALRFDDPSSLFTSQEQLDKCIKNLVRSVNLYGGEEDHEQQDLLSKLYDFRQKIEMDKPTGKSSIFNSRQISEGQFLRVLVEGSGVYRSQVVRNDGDALIISLPVSSKPNGTLPWLGQKISIYFWREEDAGYVFDSEVLDELFSKGLASLRINHSDALFRTQKRRSIRIKVHKPAYLYLLEYDEMANVPETEPGLSCYLEDLSDSGCAIMVGGLGQSDMRIKIQFALNNYPIVMSGTVRSVAYKEDLNRSLLRVEADPLPIDVRNKILGEVFGTMPDDDDDLPFKQLAEETETAMADRGIGAVARGDLENFGISFN